jgi:hypothetical protein
METTLIFRIFVNVSVLTMLTLDLEVFYRKLHELSTKEALPMFLPYWVCGRFTFPRPVLFIVSGFLLTNWLWFWFLWG